MLLVAAQPSDRAVLEGLTWFVGVVVTMLLAAVVVAYLMRRLRARDETWTPRFTLEQLRRLKERGDLTDAEYHALRQRTLGGE
ncbi:MAG: SHOCT domain-containing protein [Planctomycetes bacterium]|nr:SHOCT domain-containing protein [Planctomycetota bacterium]